MPELVSWMREVVQAVNSSIGTIARSLGTVEVVEPTMRNQVALDDRKRCDGCGVQFEPKLDGDLCPTCVDIIIKHNLDPEDWEQHRLREEYGDA